LPTVPATGLGGGAVAGLRMGLGLGVLGPLVFGPLYGLIFGLIGALGSGEVESTVMPNQGIWRSFRNTIPGGLIGALAGGLYGALLGGLSGTLMYGLVFGLVGALAYGGYACLSHLALRFVLSRNGSMPLHIVPFLDYCAERILLRKVGGGYIFVHRLLMEHFASLQGEPPSEQTGSRDDDAWRSR